LGQWVMTRMSEEIAGFDFHIPPEQDPYLEDLPEDIKREVH